MKNLKVKSNVIEVISANTSGLRTSFHDNGKSYTISCDSEDYLSKFIIRRIYIVTGKKFFSFTIFNDISFHINDEYSVEVTDSKVIIYKREFSFE